MQFTFDHSEETAANIRTFWFRPDKRVPYTAGQFTELEIPHDNPDERGIKHWFTLSSSPTSELYSITTKFAKKGSSFKRALRALKPGTKLFAADPMGDFVLPKNANRPLLFVAGGIGVTPFHSIIQWLKDTNEKRDIQLIYAANTLDQVAFRELFESYPMNFEIDLKEPPPDWKGSVGTLSSELILGLADKPKEALIYVSGPEPMVESLMDQLEKAGVDKQRLVGDFFPGYVSV